jgi:hypothetical protein
MAVKPWKQITTPDRAGRLGASLGELTLGWGAADSAKGNPSGCNRWRSSAVTGANAEK